MISKSETGLLKVEAKNVGKTFGNATAAEKRVVALNDVSFGIRENEFVSIVGRSGCGKSTMLNMVAGLLLPTSGDVYVNQNVVKSPGLDRGMVFQQASLFPWLTAIRNIEFGPKNIGIPKEERRRTSLELIELVRLSDFKDKYPRELSGGMQQRVAIARALALDPDILLMDEPFGALDQLTREDMQNELLRIWQKRRKTVLFVTHSISEAIFLSDRILVFSSHPGSVKKEFSIDLPRPRHKASKEYLEHYEAIYEAIN